MDYISNCGKNTNNFDPNFIGFWERERERERERGCQEEMEER